MIGFIGAKGGVGSSTLALSLSKYFEEEKSVLLLDGDWGRRSLDVLLGQEPSVYDFYNVIKGNEDGMTVISENLSYCPASLSKTFYDIKKEELDEIFSKLEERFSHIIVDFSKKSAKELELFYPYLTQIFLITSDDIPGFIQGEGLYQQVKRKNRHVSVVINGVKNSTTTVDWLKNHLPLWEEYHMIKYCDYTSHDDGALATYPLEEMKRIWEATEKGTWEQPKIEPPTFWEKIRGRK